AARWEPTEHMSLLDPVATVELEGRPVQLRCWRYDVRGVSGHVVPVYMLDADLPENHPDDRQVTRKLYMSDPAGRFRQEALLGIGGVRMLQALGLGVADHYHMNEGHAALLVLELLRIESERAGLAATDPQVIESVRRRCVFTTHTPVAAGHDKFPLDLVHHTIEPTLLRPLDDPATCGAFCEDGMLNMTFLGFSLSKYINGVAKRHGEVSRSLFGRYPIDSITNGVHAATWVSRPFAELFDQHLPGWREDNATLRYAVGIPLEEIRNAHARAKRTLVETVNWRINAGFDQRRFTIGFARRATAYKRAELLLADPGRLRAMAEQLGGLQIIFAGKAHPNDHGGKEMIKRIVGALEPLRPAVHGVYLPNYDMGLAQVLVPGVDLWLNTPQPPLEASGTSGMKAALNGVPSLSTLDGWWLEGHVEGVTGWAIGRDDWTAEARVDQTASSNDERNTADAAALYDKLAQAIVPLYLDRPDGYAEVMRSAIALNGSFFNTHRMMREYVLKAYFG
ncbi:MAG: alpha-glucan family phosphorylase, partial [Phycisphaerales bacterium]|nr:alpha-glucan family phosphorylase [Phycisphaerales bacterium]